MSNSQIPTKSEDNALVVGAADNVMIDGASLSYDGANLAIGAGDQTSDSLWLANRALPGGIWLFAFLAPSTYRILLLQSDNPILLIMTPTMYIFMPTI